MRDEGAGVTTRIVGMEEGLCDGWFVGEEDNAAEGATLVALEGDVVTSCEGLVVGWADT